MNKLQCLNSTTIKITAIVLMVCDHIHQMFYYAGAPLWLTFLGRLVFPLFLFAAADSFHYTRDRKKYLIRLLCASWVMTVMTVALQALLPNEDVVLMNNAFTTFLIAGLYMLFWNRFAEGVKTKSAGKIVTAILLCFVPVIASLPTLLLVPHLAELPLATTRIIMTALMLIPNLLMVEGGFVMVALGVAFYILRQWRLAQVGVLLVLSAGLAYLNGLGDPQWLMCFAAIPMLLYNGAKGRGMKRFFYIFYPAHIAVLYIAATLLF
ncbi:MAG: conjugal transfer protein TraX [Peptococcaceae bacterium]|jgi:hypothetical protein|nr:conjugal transfer protein TraX [Peptococcaceae bacterium]